MKVALVHDWLVTYRGGEKVLESLCRLYPEAPIFTLFYEPGTQSDTIERHRITESPLAKIPGARGHHRAFLPLYPWAIEQFDLSDYDLVISTSHAVAKGIITRSDAVHVCYVHTPMRYVWELGPEYFGAAHPLVRTAASVVSPLLRLWDESSERRVDYFLCNSVTVQRRIKKRYRREAVVIHPPVDTGSFHLAEPKAREDYYLAVSAMVPYKRLDVLLEAFAENGRRLKVVGDGPERARLTKLAGPNTEFLGYQSGPALADLYARCRAFVFPGEEDFGITPLEAMASGRPVIALGRGGATETVMPSTGILYPPAEGLSQAILRFEREEQRFDPVAIAAWARGFGRERFEQQLRERLADVINETGLVARAC